MALALAVGTTAAAAAFVPAAAERAAALQGREPGRSLTVLRAEQKDGDAMYDWQKVATSAGSSSRGSGVSESAALDLDNLPDLPDFSEEDLPSSGAKVASVPTTIREREVLPDLPGVDRDLVPPAPNPIMQTLGFLEWTGIWIGGLIVIAAIGGAFSWGLARAKVDPAFADTLLQVLKVVFSVFQVLFLGRVLLTQFPKIKTTDLPWALAHYPTEWILAPTRAVFPPEAGVDISPIIWLLVILLATELITGPSGILMMAKNAPVVDEGGAFFS